VVGQDRPHGVERLAGVGELVALHGNHALQVQRRHVLWVEREHLLRTFGGPGEVASGDLGADDVDQRVRLELLAVQFGAG
jgi:hypothetical protein